MPEIVDIGKVSIPNGETKISKRTRKRYLDIVLRQGLIEPLVVNNRMEVISNDAPELLQAMIDAGAKTVIIARFADLDAAEQRAILFDMEKSNIG